MNEADNHRKLKESVRSMKSQRSNKKRNKLIKDG